MARQVVLTVPSSRTEPLLDYLRQAPGVGGIQVQRGAALVPPGDVVTVQATNRASLALLEWCARQGIGTGPDTLVTTTEPFSTVAPAIAGELARDVNEAGWEEMRAMLRRFTGSDANYLLVMAGVGVIAAVGVAQDALHLVVAAMLIAPDYLPLQHISLGLVARSVAWREGLRDTLIGYLALLTGAVFASAVMVAFGVSLTTGQAAYLPKAGTLLDFWTVVSPTVVLVALTAGVAGAALVAARQPSPTGGISIAYALVPSMAIVGVAIVAGEWGMAGVALWRWLVGAAFAVLGGAVVFLWKRVRANRRRLLS